MQKSTGEPMSPKLWHMTSVSGVFVASPLLYPARSSQHPSLLPYLQQQLYHTPQPALFLLDTGVEIYLWVGWQPQLVGEENDNAKTGSQELRLNTDKRCAMETALNYTRLRGQDLGKPLKSWLIFAGLEPLEFTNLFPYWNVDEEARALQLQNGYHEGEMLDLPSTLKALTRSHYSWQELTSEPLPEGVDPLKIESYLSDMEFQEHFKMAKAEYYSLPQWKQKNLRKSAGLF